ncbi:MAG: hypothetical protein B7Z02_02555 [Rhodobacterales bacterium 32-67-9]|nr:MAG: hypothetical protein B7Z02_02555 [Rhodobacterales bacterium 32-67-9]
MIVRNVMRGTILAGIVATLSSCGGIGSGDSGLFRRKAPPTSEDVVATEEARQQALARQRGTNEGLATKSKSRTESAAANRNRSRFFDLFRDSTDPNNTVEVNKYLWQASLEVLDFLPIQSVDPFSGVIVTGFGTPPGGGRAYRATIYVQDPALDARSLKVALMSKAGPVDPATARAVEDAILTRARQLRIRDSKL